MMNVVCVLGLLSLTTALPAGQQTSQQQQQQVEEVAKLVLKKQVVSTALAPVTDAAYDTVKHVVKTAIDTEAAKALFNGGVQAATYLIAVELQEQALQAVTSEMRQQAQQKMIAAGFKEATKIAARAAAKQATIQKYVIPSVEDFLTEQINAVLSAAAVEAATSYVMQEVVEEIVTQTMKMMAVERTLQAASVAVIEATVKSIIVEAATESAQEIVKAEVIENSMQQAFTSMLFDNLMEGCTAVVETPVAARKTLRESVDYWYEYINAIWHSGVSWHGPSA